MCSVPSDRESPPSPLVSLLMISWDSVVAASTPEKAKEVASEAKDAAQDTASSAQQQRPVGYVASARDLAASAIGTVQG